MKRILFVLALCCLMAIPLVGCGGGSSDRNKNAISMQVVAGRSSVSQSFAFPAGVKNLPENTPEEKIAHYIEELESAIKLKIWNRMFLNYFAVYSQNPNNDFLIGGENVDFKQAAYNRTTDRVEFSFNFKSYAAWNYYHPKSSEGEEQEDANGENLFLKIDQSQGQFPFAQETEAGRVGEIYAKVISDTQAACFDSSELEKFAAPDFEYQYITTHKRVHSNADAVEREGDYYRHIWRVSDEGLGSGKTVELKTVNANRGWWYLVALGSALAVAGIASGALFISDKLKKSKIDNKKKG